MLPHELQPEKINYKPTYRGSASNLIILFNSGTKDERRFSTIDQRRSPVPRKLSPELFKKFGDVVNSQKDLDKNYN